ncbi:MAG TPA: prolipoprotein diacylglyceryl transferase [Feifaniaceae bacterium]|nr:prolipoprotein diacylglyceryl transferase [Feifaniaceae bacterium]
MINPDRVAFSVFGRDIYWYGVLMALGIVIAVLLAMREAKRKQLNEDTVLDLSLVIIPCGVVGARLYYVLFELDQYLADPIRMLYIWEGGLAIFGAVIGGLIGMLAYSRKKKLRFLKMADLVAPGLVLAQAIGRWGNFFNQEAYGPPVTNPDLLWFPMSVKIDSPWTGGFHTFNGVPCSEPYHLATFFYESLWCFLVFLFLWFFLRKRTKHDGDLFIWYVMLYSFERMFVEGLRGDSLWLIEGSVRVSQLLSAVLFVGALGFLLVRHFKEKKLGRLIWPAPEIPAAEAAESAAAETEAHTDGGEEGGGPEAEESGADTSGEEPSGQDDEAEAEKEESSPADPAGPKD